MCVLYIIKLYGKFLNFLKLSGTHSYKFKKHFIYLIPQACENRFLSQNTAGLFLTLILQIAAQKHVFMVAAIMRCSKTAAPPLRTTTLHIVQVYFIFALKQYTCQINVNQIKLARNVEQCISIYCLPQFPKICVPLY